jgi:hypothetical protein
VRVSHILIVLSSDPEARRLPSGENVTFVTESEWPSSILSTTAVIVSHNLIVPFLDAEAKKVPSGEKALLNIPPERCGGICIRSASKFGFHSWTVLFSVPAARILLFGEKAKSRISLIDSSYREIFRTPELVSHSLIVESFDADARS